MLLEASILLSPPSISDESDRRKRSERNSMLLEDQFYSHLSRSRIQRIGEKGAREIASCLNINSTLTSLNRRCNDIGDEGAREIASCLKINSTLTSLDFGCNSIGEEGAREIASCLKINSTLTFLDLKCNKIGEKKVEEITACLNNNKEMRREKRSNWIRCLMLLSKDRFDEDIALHSRVSIACLPLDILLYLTGKYFVFGDFGMKRKEMISMIRSMVGKPFVIKKSMNA